MMETTATSQPTPNHGRRASVMSCYYSTGTGVGNPESSIAPKAPSSCAGSEDLDVSWTSSSFNDDRHASKRRTTWKKSIFHCVLNCWNIRTLLVIVFTFIVAFSNLSSIVVGTFYNQKIIDVNNDVIQGRGMHIIKSLARDTLFHLVTEVEHFEIEIEKRILAKNISLENYTTGGDALRDIFQTRVRVDQRISGALFVFTSGDMTGVASGPNGTIKEMHMSYINGSRYLEVFLMKRDSVPPHSEKERLLYGVYGRPYSAWGLEYFRRKPSDVVDWNIFVTKANTEVVHPFKSIYQNGNFVGKVVVYSTIVKVSEQMKELDEILFMFTEKGELVASSTFDQDDTEKELKIYDVSKYPNIHIRKAVSIIKSKFGNYSDVVPTDYPISFTCGGDLFFMEIERFSVKGSLVMIIVSLLPESAIIAQKMESLVISIVISIVFFAISFITTLIIGLFFSMNISRLSQNLVYLSTLQIEKIRKMVCCGGFNLLEYRRIEHSMGVLIQGMNNLNKFLPLKVLRRYLIRENTITTRLSKQNISCFFVDLVGFSSLSEKCTPMMLVNRLQVFFSICGSSIERNKGIIDKFIGDAVMALFRGRNHSSNCCKAVLEIQRLCNARSFINEYGEEERCSIRCGVNSGDMFVGFIGSEKRLSYTAIGDEVNIASRLEPMNKMFDTVILVGENTYEATKEKFVYRWVGCLKIRGRVKPIDVWNLVRVNDKELSDRDRFVGYNKIRVLCREGKFDEVKMILEDFEDDAITKFVRDLEFENC